MSKKKEMFSRLENEAPLDYRFIRPTKITTEKGKFNGAPLKLIAKYKVLIPYMRSPMKPLSKLIDPREF